MAAMAGGYRDVPVRFSAPIKAALQRQLQVRQLNLLDGASAVGWKIAADMPGVTASEGIRGRIFGYLTSETVVVGSAPITAGPTVDLSAEVELTVEVAHNVPPDVSPGMAAEAIAGLTVALEIVDVDEQTSAHDIIVANVFHRAVSFGPLQPLTSLTTAWARLEVDGQVESEINVDLDPARTIWMMARLLGAFGEQLQAGDRVIGGSLIHRSVEPRHHIAGVISGIGETSLNVAP
jgi:2-keto-4-pentenoate hydratase